MVCCPPILAAAGQAAGSAAHCQLPTVPLALHICSAPLLAGAAVECDGGRAPARRLWQQVVRDVLPIVVPLQVYTPIVMLSTDGDAHRKVRTRCELA